MLGSLKPTLAAIVVGLSLNSCCDNQPKPQKDCPQIVVPHVEYRTFKPVEVHYERIR
jgi:hypothetical protein